MDNSLKEELKTGKDDFQGYLNARFDLLRLNMAENFSKVFSGFIIKGVILLLLSLILLFFSLGLGDWLNTVVEMPGIGYVIVAGFYLLLIIIFWALRHKLIEKPIIEAMINIFFPPEHDFETNEDEQQK